MALRYADESGVASVMTRGTSRLTAEQSEYVPLTEEGGAIITYEQPLNERVRVLLRLEHLFVFISERISGFSEWDSRAALGGLIDITDVLWRSDIKGELIKELERHLATFSRLRSNPHVDCHRLNETLLNHDKTLKILKHPGYQPGHTLRQDELINAVKQRTAIPGGTCNFDLPAYHYWLNRPSSHRLQRIHGWLDELSVIRDGVFLALHAIRDSAYTTRVAALGGFYQQSLEPTVAHQLIRVQVPSVAELFPEVSAGKHRFTIRFLGQPETSARPVQTGSDVEFDLQCCIL